MRVVRVRCKLESADYAAGKNETLRERIIVLADLHRDPLDATLGMVLGLPPRPPFLPYNPAPHPSENPQMPVPRPARLLLATFLLLTACGKQVTCT